MLRPTVEQPAGESTGTARPDGKTRVADPDEIALDRFMAEAGRILGVTLDVEATLAQVASLAVPQIADWCSIDLLGPDGTLEPLAVAHQDEWGSTRRARQLTTAATRIKPPTAIAR